MKSSYTSNFSLCEYCLQSLILCTSRWLLTNVLYKANKCGLKPVAKIFNFIQHGPFQAYSHLVGGQKGPPCQNLSQMFYNDETGHNYTLPKEDPKNIWITWHTDWVLLISAIFHEKSANFVISENTGTDCILVHNY